MVVKVPDLGATTEIRTRTSCLEGSRATVKHYGRLGADDRSRTYTFPLTKRALPLGGYTSLLSYIEHYTINFPFLSSPFGGRLL